MTYTPARGKCLKEWEWQLSSDSTASMLAAEPSVYRLFMVGGDKVPNVGSYKLLGPKLDKVIGCRVLLLVYRPWEGLGFKSVSD